MTEEEAVDEVVEYIRRTDYVSFAELTNRFGALFGGTISVEQKLTHGGTAVYWHGFSELGASVFKSKKFNDAVGFATANWMIYLIDGHALKLPLMTSARKFKGERWCPLSMRPIERIPEKKRLGRWDAVSRVPA